MNFLIFHLKRLLALPFELISSPSDFVGSMWSQSGRSRSLMLGLPAVFLAVIGVSFLLWANYGLAGSLEDRYKAKLEESADAKSRLVDVLRQEVRMLKVTQQTSNDPTAPKELIPKDDPRRVELENWRSREKIYLEKLIDLNPEQAEYLYQLAIVSYENRDLNRCLALMNLTAPLDEPGYVDGHLWLATFYMQSPVKTRREALRNVSLALAHADQCLKREQSNIRAKQIKATLLYKGNGDLNAAYEIFDEMFQDDARYFKTLVDINKKLKKTERSDAVLDSAIKRFLKQVNDESLESTDKIGLWRDLINCYGEQKRFDVAEEKLLSEIKKVSELGEESSRLWLERMLASVYVGWIGTLDLDAEGAGVQRLGFLKKAYRYDPNNRIVLRQLTRLVSSDDTQIALEAKSIYDGTLDPDAPAGVFNEIGMQALSRTDYVKALDYFKKARTKSPKNPEILNNLAYTLLVCEQPNPEQGLKLVDEALRFLPRDESSKKYLSYFHDTRGQALMQLNRWTDAIAEFELAVIDRPEERQILESLVKCFQASGLEPGPWKRRLDSLDSSDSQPRTPTVPTKDE